MPNFHHELMTRCQRAVNEADIWLTELGTGPVKVRIARLLVRLVDAEPGDTCFLSTREELGAIPGGATESVSRATADLKRSGLIEYVGLQRVRVKVDELRQIASRPFRPALVAETDNPVRQLARCAARWTRKAAL